MWTAIHEFIILVSVNVMGAYCTVQQCSFVVGCLGALHWTVAPVSVRRSEV